MTSTKKLIELVEESDIFDEDLPENLDVYIPGNFYANHVYIGDDNIHYQHELAYEGDDSSNLDIRYLPQ